MIHDIARFSSFFPNFTFLIMKSYSKSTAEKQGKIWWLVTRLDDLGVPSVQVVLGGFWVVSDGSCWFRIISDLLRWFPVLAVTPI